MQPAIPPEEDDDCEIDFEELLSSYTESELKQVEQLTLEVLTHWTNMLATQGETLPKETRDVLESCLQHAKDDLELIHIKMKSFTSPPTSPYGEISDSS